MKKLFSFLIFITLFSCDDGDIIVTSFEFDDVDLQLCEGSIPNEFVFFKINTAINEAISYNFINPIYDATTETIDENGMLQPIVIDLAENDNNLIYRTFNTAITSDYYCSNIPDSNIEVTNEIVAVGGEVTIENRIVIEDDQDGVEASLESPNEIEPLGDPDDDGVPNFLDDAMANPAIGDEDGLIQEGFDKDRDGIADFKDQDDDNDNVLTSVELPNNDPDDDSFEDTDGDGIFNYLDEDDDNDGINTIDEDINADGNPRDDDTDQDGISNYIDMDDDGDGILTVDEDIDGDGNPRNDNSDDDDIPNYLDEDDDNDGINTIDEGTGDDDMDGIPNHLDADSDIIPIQINPGPARPSILDLSLIHI